MTTTEKPPRPPKITITAMQGSSGYQLLITFYGRPRRKPLPLMVQRRPQADKIAALVRDGMDPWQALGEAVAATPIENVAAKAWGVRGAHARAAALTPERRKEIGQKAIAARWAKARAKVAAEAQTNGQVDAEAAVVDRVLGAAEGLDQAVQGLTAALDTRDEAGWRAGVSALGAAIGDMKAVSAEVQAISAEVDTAARLETLAPGAGGAIAEIVTADPEGARELADYLETAPRVAPRRRPAPKGKAGPAGKKRATARRHGAHRAR